MEAGFSKADVRELSRHLELPTWEKGSFACLSSRFPYGMAISLEALSKIDNAENLLRDLGFREFRVRYHDERTARIEVGAKEIWNAVTDEHRSLIVARLKGLGGVGNWDRTLSDPLRSWIRKLKPAEAPKPEMSGC